MGSQEKPGDQEEVRHSERARPFDEMMDPSLATCRLLDAERRVHHHDQNDADALGDIDPFETAAFGVLAHGALRARKSVPMRDIGRCVPPRTSKRHSNEASACLMIG
jgi:hypothetical protein